MPKKIFYKIFLVLLMLVFYCQLPVNPLQNYDNCSVEISFTNKDTVFFPEDTIELSIALNLPHLIDSLILSFDDVDSTINCDYAEISLDSIKIKRVYSTPDTISLNVKAILNDKTERTASITIMIAGKKPTINKDLKKLYSFESGFACTLSVAATGTDTLRYQWYKKDSLLENETLDTLILPYLQVADTGTYTCIVSNTWGTDTSEEALVLIKQITNKSVYWNFGVYSDSLFEGDTLKLLLDTLYTKTITNNTTFSFVNDSSNALFDSSRYFIFTADIRDSGLYSLPVIVKAGKVADTSTITIKVLPRYCTLTMTSDSGTVTVNPQADSYRFGDTVTISAEPSKGYRFLQWSGDITGTDTLMNIVITDNFAIAGKFQRESASECYEINSGSLNKAIQESSPSLKRPGTVCPEEGLYDDGTIQILGTVKFVFQ